MRRSPDAYIDQLAAIIASGCRTVFITGAGLSAASGIPTFRGESDSVWSVTSAAKGRRAAFLRNPLKWYNEFWLHNFPHSFTQRPPNAGHEAVAALAASFANVAVITQNVDALHQQTAHPWSFGQQLAEVHGRLGLYKCVRDGCRFSLHEAIPADGLLPPGIGGQINGHAGGRPGALAQAPLCPGCGQPAPPMALMFDEQYESHAFYAFQQALDWMAGAAAFVFIGTSYAVTITSLALDEARQRRIPVFDFNLHPTLKSSPALDVRSIGGAAEVNLPLLVARLRKFEAERELNVSAADVGAAAHEATAHSALMLDSGAPCVALKPELRESLMQGDVSGYGIESPQKRARSYFFAPTSAAAGCNAAAAAASDAELPTPLAEASNGVSSAATAAGGQFSATLAVVKESCGGSSGGGCGRKEGLRYDLDPILPVPLGAGAVAAVLSPQYSRRRHPDPAVEERIEELWQEQVRRDGRVFNGSKFRLAGFRCCNVTANGVSLPHRSHSLTLFLALTDYKDFRGTNWSPEAARLLTDGQRTCNDRFAYLSQKLGVSAVVELADGGVLLIRRSRFVAEGKGAVDVPGGHPEPHKLGLTHEMLVGLDKRDSNGAVSAGNEAGEGSGSGGDVTGSSSGSTTSSSSGSSSGGGGSSGVSVVAERSLRRSKLERECVCELFGSAVDEVVDETNVPRSSLTEPLLLGVIAQKNSAGTPSAAFVVRCALTAEQVMQHYRQGPKEAFETTGLLVAPAADLEAMGTERWFQANGLEPTPSCEGAIELWLRLRTRRGS